MTFLGYVLEIDIDLLQPAALFGLAGSIWSIVVAGVLYWYLNAWMLRATLDISVGEVMRQLRRPLLATAFMVAVVAGVAAVAPQGVLAAGAPGGVLVVKILLGGAAFGGALYAAWRIEGRPEGIERRLAQLWAR